MPQDQGRHCRKERKDYGKCEGRNLSGVQRERIPKEDKSDVTGIHVGSWIVSTELGYGANGRQILNIQRWCNPQSQCLQLRTGLTAFTRPWIQGTSTLHVVTCNRFVHTRIFHCHGFGGRESSACLHDEQLAQTTAPLERATYTNIYMYVPSGVGS